MRLGALLRLSLIAAAAAIAAGLGFFGLLALWGLVAAPFLRLGSASLVVASALALAVAASAALTSRLARGLKRRDPPSAGRRRP